MPAFRPSPVPTLRASRLLVLFAPALAACPPDSVPWGVYDDDQDAQNARIDAVENEVEDPEADDTTLAERVAALEAKLAEAEGKLGDCLTADDLVTLESRVDGHDTEITALETSDGLQNSAIADLQTSDGVQDDAITVLQASDNAQDIVIADHEPRISAIEADYINSGEIAEVSDLMSFVAVDPTTSSVYFQGANVYIQSGSGSTYGAVNGYGNLILGYAEGDGSYDRSGSHNLVLGEANAWSSYGGIVAGAYNTVSAPHASVTGGFGNTASGEYSSVTGGANNNALQSYASISGGQYNDATGYNAWIGGGQYNIASGTDSVVSGGYANQADGEWDTVLGGEGNLGSATLSVVIGGQSNRSSGAHSLVAGGNDSEAKGALSSIVGGAHNLTEGGNAAIFGGATGRASGEWSIVSGGSRNVAAASWSMAIGGGYNDGCPDNDDVDGDGYCDCADGSYGTEVCVDASTGRGGNLSNAAYAVVIGGYNGDVSGEGSIIVGGNGNAVTPYSYYGVILAGYENLIGDLGADLTPDDYALVAGGRENQALGDECVVLGGYQGMCSSQYEIAP